MNKAAKGSRGFSMLMMVLGFSLTASSGIVNAADEALADKLGAAAEANGAPTTAGVNRYELASRVLDRWQPIAVQLGQNPVTWREIFSTQFGLMDASTLNAIAAVTADAGSAVASYARFAQTIRNAGMQAYMSSKSGKVQTKLGSPLNDYIFIPVVPCRIVDTRIVGGAIAAFGTRNFYYYTDTGSFDFGAGQGGAPGAASNVCPGTVYPDQAPRFSAAMVTVTVVSPGSAGNFIIWGGASPAPTTSALNWPTAGDVVANTTVIPGGGRSGSGPGGAILDFAVNNNSVASAQVVADVVGYFIENKATALECVQVNSGDIAIPNNSATSADASCPTGYTLTGGGFLVNEGSLGVVSDWLWTSFPVSSNTWRTNWSNQTGANRNGRTYAVCCRVPGR